MASPTTAPSPTLRRPFAAVAAFLTFLAAAVLPVAGATAAPVCSTSSPAGPAYAVKVCLSVGSASPLSGDAVVTSTVTITGSSPGIRRLEFTIDGEYLLTDFESPYTFVLPTAQFVDGSHAVRADVMLRDGATAHSPTVSTSFANGVTTPPPPLTGFTPTSGRPAHDGEPFVVAATGDGASGQKTSAAVVDLISSWNPNLFLYLGDVYEKGTATEFHNWYGQDGVLWGRFKSITNPAVGNHEYENGVAPGYFNYWSGVPDYYSYDAGGWHFIALNSNSQLDEFDPGSAQYEWLKADLAANRTGCSVAYFHHPVLSIGPQGATPAMYPLWRLMADNGVDVVLAGHEHQYQRWVPLDRSFKPAASGPVQFVAGGGGHGIQSSVTSDSRVAALSDTTADGYGALQLELSGGSAHYAYVNPNGTVRDEGTIVCSNNPVDVTAPSVPSDVTATDQPGDPGVTVQWSASTDDQGVGSYEIRRDGADISSVAGSKSSWTDTTVAPLTTYTYAVRAVDVNGNASDWSAPATVTTPPAATLFTFDVVEDGYTDDSRPTTSFGSRADLRVDASPLQRSYLRFGVRGLAETDPASVVLRVHASSSLAAGFDVAVADGPWSESSLTASSAPSAGPVVATSGPVATGTWVEIPLAGVVTGDGTYELALLPRSSTALKLDARESGFPAQLTVDLVPTVNHPPVAGDLTLTTVEDDAVSFAPSVSDPDGDPLTCAVSSSPAGGQASIATDCSTGSYVPAPDRAGADSFAYTVSDGQETATAQVDVTVTPVNDPPVIAAQAVTAAAGTSQVVTLTATDVDGDCPLTWSVLDAPATGSVSPITPASCDAGLASAELTYTAPTDPLGSDPFTVAVSDPAGGSSSSEVAVTVNAADPEFSVVASADAYVDADRPTATFGSRTDLRIDGTPQQEAYLSFPVTGLGTAAPATVELRVFAGSSLAAGFDVSRASGPWDESTLSWSTAPGAQADVLATSGPVTSGTWVTIPLSGIVTGDGVVDLVLTPRSSTALKLASRESSTAPTLRIQR